MDFPSFGRASKIQAHIDPDLLLDCRYSVNLVNAELNFHVLFPNVEFLTAQVNIRLSVA